MLNGFLKSNKKFDQYLTLLVKPKNHYLWKKKTCEH